MLFTTIIADNYQCRAVTLARSLKRFHPQATLAVLVVDRAAGSLNQGIRESNVVEMGLDDLPIDPDSLGRMRMFYDVTEFCTALKPFLLLALLSTNSTVCYLDPDMLVMDDISDIHALAEDRHVLLTPHCLTPMPRDKYEPDERALLRAGAFNLGFLAISAEMRHLLSWWAAHLELHCVNDHATGLFVDQKWFDLLPALASSYAISRDRSLNVAYWNLYERWQEDPERRPPRLFHFSGFDPSLPSGTLTGHFQRTRPLGRNGDCVAELARQYSQYLVGSGLETDRLKRYGHGSFANNRSITSHMRRRYRAAFLEGDSSLPADPWADEGAAFCAWYARHEESIDQGAYKPE